MLGPLHEENTKTIGRSSRYVEPSRAFGCRHRGGRRGMGWRREQGGLGAGGAARSAGGIAGGHARRGGFGSAAGQEAADRAGAAAAELRVAAGLSAQPDHAERRILRSLSPLEHSTDRSADLQDRRRRRRGDRANRAYARRFEEDAGSGDRRRQSMLRQPARLVEPA